MYSQIEIDRMWEELWDLKERVERLEELLIDKDSGEPSAEDK
jgi:hypothetical protein